MELKRGDIFTVVAPGDYGKPRPAVVVQSDLFNPTHHSVVICPVTSFLVDAPLFRIDLAAGSSSGLAVDSQIMVDKIQAIRKDRVGKRIGRLATGELELVDRGLSLWLGLI